MEDGPDWPYQTIELPGWGSSDDVRRVSGDRKSSPSPIALFRSKLSTDIRG